MIAHLEEVALGQLGWSEEQTLHSDINAIWIGEKGLWKKLSICFNLTNGKSSEVDSFDRQNVLSKFKRSVL